MKKIKFKKINYTTYIPFLFMAVVAFISIAYSSLGIDNLVRDISANIRLKKDVRVTYLSAGIGTNNGISENEEYNVHSISSSVELPNNNSSVTYNVKVTNIGNTEVGIFKLTGLPSNLKYEFVDYTEQKKLCDSNDNTKCSLGSISQFQIIISYQDNGFDSSKTEYDINLNFEFKNFLTITYENITNNGYPTQVIDGGTFNVDFGESAPETIVVAGSDNASYSDDALTVSDVFDNVVITGYTMKELALNSQYPKGSIYITTEPNNPSTYGCPGTWVQFGAGKTLVGIDSSDSDFNVVEKTGGEKSHTLVADELPSHTHGSKSLIAYVKNFVVQSDALGPHTNSDGIISSWGDGSVYHLSGSNRKSTTSKLDSIKIDATHTHTSFGGSGAHNNMQPYITVYMWKRTA